MSMRVTKAVREYIEKQVRAKIEQKYEWEKNESQRIRDIKNDIGARARKAAYDAAVAILRETEQYPDLFEYEELNYSNFSIRTLCSGITLKDACYINSVHKWANRMYDEVDEKVQDIIVTLELGGNEADLDRMLSEL